jgi:CheY-like chemotaxis protein
MKEVKDQKILLVEDDLISGFIAEQVLKNSEFSNSYDWVKNGQDALEWINTKDVEFVLLDLSMPVMDGFDVLESLKDNPKINTLKVIILTSSNRPSDKTRCLDHPCVKAYIEKPLSDEKFIGILNQLKSE